MQITGSSTSFMIQCQGKTIKAFVLIFVLFWDRSLYVAVAGLKQSPCLSFLSAGIADVYHHTWPIIKYWNEFILNK
jgi:hypothetical protein